jgi:hypothetical protein
MKKTYIALTGGLGNQLFQYAAGRSCAQGGPLYLFSCLGIPRSSEIGPDILEFDLGPGVEILPCDHRHVFSKRCFNLLLSLTVGRRSWISKIPLGQGLIIRVASLIFLLELRIRAQIFTSRGIGYAVMKKTTDMVFPIGYFQSFRFLTAEERHLDRLQISLINQSEGIEELRFESKVKNPLIVHVRLGDYKIESSFGILNLDYYFSAIESQMRDRNIQEIWLFSDEPDLALSRIPTKYMSVTKVMRLEGYSPAQVLEVMRFGYGYVIANSTFSWWGAFLSYKEDARVIAPSQWFRKTAEPLDLIPGTWERHNCSLDNE